MRFFKEFYFQFQELLLDIRATRKDEEEVTTEVLESWEDSLHDLDKVFRDRLFLLCIAAEKGWRIAGEVAFRKNGNVCLQRKGQTEFLTFL